MKELLLTRLRAVRLQPFQQFATFPEHHRREVIFLQTLSAIALPTLLLPHCTLQ